MKFADDTPARERARLVGLGLALVTLLVYLPAAFHDFIFFDDPAYVSANPVVQGGLSWAGWKWAWIGWHASNWHPVTWLSHMLDCQLVGVNPGAQHLINAVFHMLNTILLFHLWRRMTGALWPSAVVAALFAWHPLHVESVAWIAERKDVLSTLFGLLAALAYVRYAEKTKARAGGWMDYAAALLCFALALLSKPMLVTLPFVFGLLDFWPLKRWPAEPRDQNALVRLLGEKVPFLLLAAASCLVTFLAQRGEAVMSIHERPFGLRAENAVVSYAAYVLKTFWPTRLGIVYPLPEGYRAGEVVLAVVLLAAVSALAWQQRRRQPWVLTGWLWFLGTLVPVIGLVQVGNQALADRYTYWPSIGLFVAAVFAGAEWLKGHRAFRLAGPVFAGLVLCACVAGTERQLAYWKDTITLFSHTLAVTKENPVAEMMLGLGYERSAATAEAVRWYEEALRLDPALSVQMPGGSKRRLAVQTVLLQARLAEQGGSRTNAMALYRQALDLDPALAEAHNNLANLLDEAGDTRGALAHYEAAARLAPGAALTHENLGTELLELGRFEDAMQQYEEAGRLEPADARALFLIGKAYLRHGRSVEAVAAFRRALERDADDPQSLTLLARVLATDENPKNRDGSAAVALAEKANALTGGAQPFILDVLAMAYAEAGRLPEAQATAAKAAGLAAAAPSPALADTIRQHLQLFQAGQPCREAFTNTLATPAAK
jgi:Tfp pilus assembly protein PilF